MKKLLLIQIAMFGVTCISNAQSLDYTTTNFSTSFCNLFNTPPATVVGGLTHYPVSGGVSYDGTALILKTRGGTSQSTTFGTAYALAIQIKQGFVYNITVNMRKQSDDPVSIPSFEIGGINSLPDPNITNPVACGSVSQNSWSLLQSSILNITAVNTLNSQNYQLLQNYTANSNFAYITLLAHSGSQTKETKVLINSITILETPPTPSFTLTQSAGDVSCGTATSKIFTVNNVYNSPGALSYDWNLGANNGWKYNGVDAPATFTTSTNSITLVSSTTAASVSNVSVVPKINATGYPNLTAAVTFTSGFANNISINAPASRCPSGSFSINNLPSNATVTWQANPSNIVSFPNPSTGNPITITKQGDGSTSIIATVSVNQCQQSYSSTFFYGQTPTTGSYKVGSGSPISANNPVNYVPPSQLITLTLNNTASIPGSPFSIQKVYAIVS
ncbi:MAG: hypothetical protein EAZ35_09390 [Sphingobacteriia bacterium]|nr:MAG: hypothetical protein EAZ35_09390 [Sphingobacteriia bacterium]